MRKSKKELLNREICVDNLKLAELKYFDKEHNGIELTEPLSYIVLFNNGDDYVNLLSPDESYPVFIRKPHYTNYYGDGGETYGTKVKLLTNEEECVTGPCWLLCNNDLKMVLGDVTTLKDVQNYVLRSHYYFKDRLSLVTAKMRRFQDMRKMREILVTDLKKRDALYTFFEERQKGKSYIKL